MKTITIDQIMEHHPCYGADFIDSEYFKGRKRLRPTTFAKMESLSHDDTIWVLVRFLTDAVCYDESARLSRRIIKSIKNKMTDQQLKAAQRVCRVAVQIANGKVGCMYNDKDQAAVDAYEGLRICQWVADEPDVSDALMRIKYIVDGTPQDSLYMLVQRAFPDNEKKQIECLLDIIEKRG